jgi:predicted ATPase
MMGLRLLAENYRVLRRIDWELPKGVCALVGPNGSGKTTLLELLEVLRDILANGVSKGLDAHGTLEGFRNLHASSEELVRIALEWDSIRWQLEFLVHESTGERSYGETIIHEDAAVVEQKLGSSSSMYKGQPKNIGHDAAFHYFAVETFAYKKHVLPPISYLADCRLYAPYDLDALRKNPSVASASSVLDINGGNVFSVLRNWGGRRADRERYEFVMDGLKDAFPDVFEHLDFEPTDKTVTGRIFMPHASTSLPIRYSPSGLLTGLLHLAAVASTERGGIVALDDPENGLHPYAIKRLLAAMREWADDKDLTILLATHSPMLLDQFRDDPEHLYVMEPGREVLPVRLDQVRDRAWLARFSLGDLYKAGDFGAPAEGAAA